MVTLRADGLAKVLDGRHLARRDPAGRRLKAWQGRARRSSRRTARPMPRRRELARQPGLLGCRATARYVERGQQVETSGFQPAQPEEPSTFVPGPGLAPEEEQTVAGGGWNYSYVNEPAPDGAVARGRRPAAARVPRRPAGPGSRACARVPRRAASRRLAVPPATPPVSRPLRCRPLRPSSRPSRPRSLPSPLAPLPAASTDGMPTSYRSPSRRSSWPSPRPSSPPTSAGRPKPPSRTRTSP